jgi:acyl CoA:acetate/3-ketoacid CoA transferase alpha subunit
MSSKITTLPEAIAHHVAPGMHLHFASTPARSNAAVREIARAFRGKGPAFTLSSTGFHSMAHLFGLLGLGRRYIGCFFGDNCPVPRPNRLYTRLERDGVDLEGWSLGSYVAALRAGALGQAWGITSSLGGTSLGADLAARGRFAEVAAPDGTKLGLVAAMRPDVTFVHAAMADADGNVVSSAPYCESFWGAVGARQGVIITAEQLVPCGALRAHPETLPIPRHRVLAVCHEPFGAHSQSLFQSQSLGSGGYRDDVEHYELWRRMTQDEQLFQDFVERVLDAPDGAHGYRTWVGEARLHAARDHRAARPERSPEPMHELAARVIADRVKTRGYRAILAGVGHSFFASRLAQRRLHEAGVPVVVMVETGLYDVDCGPGGHEFLLAYENVARAGRLSAVEDVLGTLTCGSDNGCLGVLGAAQIDPSGDINSSRLCDGTVLVGSGGANDIASAAAEIVVLAAFSPTRFVAQVDYVTSPGRSVERIVTEKCVLERSAGRSWIARDIVPDAGETLELAIDRIRHAIPWDIDVECTTQAWAETTAEAS